MKSLTIFFLVLFVVNAFVAAHHRRHEKCERVDCPRQNCIGKKRWNPIKCKCECPKSTKCFPAGAHFNEETCEYSFCTPPAGGCQGKQIFVEVPDCACKCPVNMQEPADYDRSKKVWDSVNCVLKCINDMSSTPKDGFKWNYETCSYDCTRTDADCVAPQKVNGECQCACPVNMQEPANYDRSKKVWDSANCVLKCINDMSSTPKDGFKWNYETCSYDCARTDADCVAPQKVNGECQCACPNDMSGTPKTGFTWNSNTCQYDCSRSDSECTAPQTIDGNCECACPVGMQEPSDYDRVNKKWNSATCCLECVDPYKDCGDPNTYIFDSDTCTCACVDPEPEGGCSAANPLEVWFTEFCDCKCSNFLTERPNCDAPNDPRRWNNSKCKCECKNTPVCDPSTHVVDEVNCECDCIAQPPEGGCPLKDYAWSRANCQCELCTACRSATGPAIGAN